MFLGEKEFLFRKDMIVFMTKRFKVIFRATSTPSPWVHDCSLEKKGLSCSLGQFKFLPGNMNVLQGKRQLP